MEDHPKYQTHMHSYMALRKAVGLIGMLLPFVMMLGVSLIFREDILQDSISHYYHTGMRDLFVGALCAVALFMFFYCGYNKTDARLGNIAGVLALGVAWFPVTPHGEVDIIGMVHYLSAALLFGVFAIFSLLQFTKTDPGSPPTPQKLKRNIVYRTSGIVIILCILLMGLYSLFLKEHYTIPLFIFWGETIALLAFGISWLVKGEAVLGDE